MAGRLSRTKAINKALKQSLQAEGEEEEERNVTAVREPLWY